MHLPPESATVRRIVGPDRTEWTLTNELLASVVDRLTWLVWTKTKDASRRAAKPPKPIPRPSNEYGRASLGRLKGALMLPVDEVKRRLAFPRRPAKEWEGPGREVGSD